MVKIKLFFRDEFDMDEIEDIANEFDADLDYGLNIAYYSGESERGQEFIRAIETIELPISCIMQHQ